MGAPVRIHSLQRPRKGFTIVEMLVSMTLLLVIVGLTIPFFRSQAKSLDRGAGRLDAQQNARFGVNAIDRELRVAGLGTVDAQPMIVYAGERVLAFNADLATATPNDGSAVYYNPDLPDAVLYSIGKPDRRQLPNTSFWYPDTTYRQGNGGPTSAAETIIFWVAPDTTGGSNSNDFALWRQVNTAPPAMLAAGIRLNPGEAVFRYVKADSMGRPVDVPPAALPYYHSAPVHGMPSGAKPDTGISARTDSLRSIRIRLVGVFRDPRDKEVLDTVETTVRIMNAGLNRYTTCGEKPFFGGAPVATRVVLPTGAWAVEITWNRATDESAGEKDVERYAVYRRRDGAGLFDDEPIAILPADGRASYNFNDSDVLAGDNWQYGVDAQDCSPAASDIAVTAIVNIP